MGSQCLKVKWGKYIVYRFIITLSGKYLGSNKNQIWDSDLTSDALFVSTGIFVLSVVKFQRAMRASICKVSVSYRRLKSFY